VNKYLVLVLLILLCNTAFSQFDEQSAFSYLENVFNKHDKNLRNYLDQEINGFLKTFPNGEKAADAQFLLAQVLEEKGEKHQAFVCYFKIVVLYPQTNVSLKAIDNTRYFLGKEDDYKESQAALLEFIDRTQHDSLLVDRYYKYLDLLVGLEQKRLTEWTQNSINDFVQRYPQDERIDKVILWKANAFLLDNKKNEAKVSFEQLSTIFPESHLLPEALYSQGELLTEKLGKHEDAITALSELVEEYPESSFVADAFFLLGQIKEKKTKDYQGAINEYGKLVEKYPDYFKVYDAYWAIAKIYKDRLKEFDAALNTLDEIVAKDSLNYEGINALEEKASIYRKKLKEPVLAAEAIANIAAMFPEYEKAPDRLLDAGDWCEKEAGEYELAIGYYKQIVENYPDHKKTRDAIKKIEKIEEKLGVQIGPEQYETEDKEGESAEEEKAESFFGP
jgi:TolA-binding protein